MTFIGTFYEFRNGTEVTGKQICKASRTPPKIVIIGTEVNCAMFSLFFHELSFNNILCNARL